MIRKILVVLAVVIAAGGIWWRFGAGGRKRADAAMSVRYDTSAVTRGDVASTIAASGTIEPEELIDVGAQVSGKIVAFGTGLAGEEIDYCSAVTNGMVLARIDDVTYLADLDVARAQLESAEAAVASAKANSAKAQVDFAHAKKDLERAENLLGSGVMTQSDFDSYKANCESAEAQANVSAASIRQAEAQVVQARASLEKAERNLGYCTITSPVDGVVVDRRVNMGQTVVSSMSVSSLFLVAKDLRHMRIWAAVNEADIGQIHEGQGVSFTVDTFQGRVFRGTVRRVRLNATITSNVVTYTVEIDCENPDSTLLPYLTANVEFETAVARDALVVPSRALRFAPPGVSPPPARDGEGVVWVAPSEEGGAPRPVPVRVLLNNGSDAAVEPIPANGLGEGDEVVTKATFAAAAAGAAPKGAPAGAPSASGGSDGAQNPFMPKMPKPPKNRGGPPPG